MAQASDRGRLVVSRSTALQQAPTGLSLRYKIRDLAVRIRQSYLHFHFLPAAVVLHLYRVAGPFSI